MIAMGMVQFLDLSVCFDRLYKWNFKLFLESSNFMEIKVYMSCVKVVIHYNQ